MAGGKALLDSGTADVVGWWRGVSPGCVRVVPRWRRGWWWRSAKPGMEKLGCAAQAGEQACRFARLSLPAGGGATRLWSHDPHRRSGRKFGILAKTGWRSYDAQVLRRGFGSGMEFQWWLGWWVAVRMIFCFFFFFFLLRSVGKGFRTLFLLELIFLGEVSSLLLPLSDAWWWVNL